jgi:hypothetical protein
LLCKVYDKKKREKEATKDKIARFMTKKREKKK